jgi:hypothetical protein
VSDEQQQPQRCRESWEGWVYHGDAKFGNGGGEIGGGGRRQAAANVESNDIPKRAAAAAATELWDGDGEGAGEELGRE